MTSARQHHVFSNESVYFHLMNRCVRRAFLCGKDKLTGKRFDHRKRWLEKRLFELSELFYMDLYGYAILSNHYHLIVQTRPDEMRQASDEEIARRWCRLFVQKGVSEALRVSHLIQDEKRIRLYRDRLSDISWLMRCLNEPVARQANQEDKVTGRFWQGRFKSQVLLDEAAVLTCMAYVDLNPIRAGLAKTPETSKYTSIHYRITHHPHQGPIEPLTSTQIQSYNKPNISLSDYLLFIDEVGRQVRAGNSGYIPDKAKPILDRLKINPTGYEYLLRGLLNQFCKVIGHQRDFAQVSERMGLNWLKGQKAAKAVFKYKKNKIKRHHLSD